MLGRMIATAPELVASEDLLGQTVAWSSNDLRPRSLADYIASRAPDQAKKLHLSLERKRSPVPRVTDLSEAELREVVCARLQEGTEGTRLAVLNKGALSISQLIDEVREGTDLGRRLVMAERRSIDLLERLVDAGKLRLPDEDEDGILLPDIPF